MNWVEPKVYAVKHKDESIRAASRSGGIFTALSDEVLDKNGVVYGCVLTKDFLAVHVRAEDVETRNRMRGSKYIESQLGDTFKKVKNDLDENRKVLFSGTSCQIAGLRGFLGKDYENLLCVDIVCHGVPSPLMWKEYIKWQEERNGGKTQKIDFRNKRDFGWKAHIETLTLMNENGHEMKVNSDIFRRLFYGHNILRPSCFECPYKSIIHPGDITIADYWGIDKAAPEFNDDRGVSLVLVNNNTGDVAFDKVKPCLIWKATRIEDSLQPPLVKSFDRPAAREKFWKEYRSRGFDYIAIHYGMVSFKQRIIGKIKKLIKK